MVARRTRLGRLFDTIERLMGDRSDELPLRTRARFEADTFTGKTPRNSEKLNKQHLEELRKAEQAKNDEQ